jgi:type II secretory pathway pseudopilin PulG
MKNRFPKTRPTGISLIEILVVLVLLTIGILSVIRIFPPGFLLNQRTEEMTRASKLASLTSGFYTAGAANLPDAIVPLVYNGSTSQFEIDSGVTPEDLSEVAPEPEGQFPWSYYFSGVNKTRRVQGESVRIPLPSPVQTPGGSIRGSVYMLRTGPFMDVNWPNQQRSIFVHGAPLVRRTRFEAQSEPVPSAFGMGPQEYAIDYDDKKIAFAPSIRARRFLITYAYHEPATNQVKTVVNEAIDVPGDPPTDEVPANYDGWITFGVNLPQNAVVVQFNETVTRRFKDLTTDPSFPNIAWDNQDPYQFYVRSAKEGGLFNAGVLVFNPYGHTWVERNENGQQPLTAYIDYDTLDWHVIREDRAMPASAPYQVPLSLKGIKQLDEVLDDQSTYNGLIHGVDKAQNIGDVVIYNTTTGQQVPRINPTTNLPNYYVNHKEGRVTFHDNFGNANASATFRFFYKAHGDWALVVQKATTTYRRRDPSSMGAAYNEFYVIPPATQASTRVYFAPSEAGKTVAVREIRYTDATGQSRRLSNVSFRINADRGLFETLGSARLTWFDIKEKDAGAATLDEATTGQAVNGVQGLSFRTRVLWRNGTSVSQDSTGNNVYNTRWRKVDVDNILTRRADQ